MKNKKQSDEYGQSINEVVGLLLLVLGIKEDEMWNKLALERDTKDAVYVSHEEAFMQ